MILSDNRPSITFSPCNAAPYQHLIFSYLAILCHQMYPEAAFLQFCVIHYAVYTTVSCRNHQYSIWLGFPFFNVKTSGLITYVHCSLFLDIQCHQLPNRWWTVKMVWWLLPYHVKAALQCEATWHSTKTCCVLVSGKARFIYFYSVIYPP